MLVRTRWPHMKDWLREVKRRHHAMIHLAEQKYGLYQQSRLRHVIKMWKAHGRYLILLQHRAAIIIQSLGRRYNQRKRYHYKKFCVVRANALFAIAVQVKQMLHK
jgi:hypothetical protein